MMLERRAENSYLCDRPPVVGASMFISTVVTWFLSTRSDGTTYTVQVHELTFFVFDMLADFPNFHLSTGMFEQFRTVTDFIKSRNHGLILAWPPAAPMGVVCTFSVPF